MTIEIIGYRIVDHYNENTYCDKGSGLFITPNNLPPDAIGSDSMGTHYQEMTCPACRRVVDIETEVR